MKTIIVPIDFSDASANALSFAAELCNRAAARIIIVNIIQNEEDEETAKNKLTTTESDLKNSFGAGLNCESLIAHGDLITSLKKLIAVQQPDLIVMGTKGATGLKRILIGSNTVKVIANINVPVFVIPEVARFEDFSRKGKNRIVLATDLEFFENEAALAVLKEIALLIIEPKIRVLNVRPEDTGLPDVKRSERNFLLSFFNPEIETERMTIFSDDVMDGINYYLNEKASDSGMVAMIARDSGGLFQKHHTRVMASYTHLPLLVLRETEV